MGVKDIILMVAIVGAAFYVLYRSVWKKKGHCSGCDGCACDQGKEVKTKK